MPAAPPAVHIARVLELVAANDESYTDELFHRALYDIVKTGIAPHVAKSATPPLPLLVYAVRSILQPFFVLQQIPALLRLLVHLEIARSTAVNTIQRILAQSGDHVLPLDSPQRNALQALVKPQRLNAQRTVYRKVIDGSCLLHIHHLWRVYNPENDPPLTSVFTDYFPTFVQRDPAARQQAHQALRLKPWHYAVTEDELVDNQAVAHLAAEFMVSASQYLADRDTYCNDHGFDPDAPFDDIFPPPDANEIAKAIMRYVNMAIKVVDSLEGVLDRA